MVTAGQAWAAPDGPVVFVDTEFTTLDERHRRPWEIAVIRDTGRRTTEHVWIIEDLDLTNAAPEALAVGGFGDRYPAPPADGAERATEAEVAAAVAELTQDARWVGVVPDADAGTITAMLRRHGLTPGWHYQLIDAAVYAAGALGVVPPSSSWEVSTKLGITAEGRNLHHALEDARWARDLFFAALNAHHSPGPVRRSVNPR
ncbi:exonuclease domain-containing protein [Nocardiopsis sp. LOL_012]|uniref:exonuclease domain-containing protein n=1 Tax=Nocardiopsis sp. LOL_012 TaxID=3345409 RepID=UPI003A85E8A2